MEKIYLKDYRAPAFEVEWIELEFDLTEDLATVTNHMALRKSSHSTTAETTLELCGEKMELVSVFMDGRELKSSEYIKTEETLKIPNVPQQFEMTITTRFNPKLNTELTGLYFSGGFLCTQCEAEGFRRITYFLDRPDVMTKYHVTIRADKKKFPVLLSNGNRLASRDLGDGRHEAEWEDPFKKPSYLFALVAGDLGMIRDEFVTMSDRKINLEIYAPHGKQDMCHHAMRSLKHAMKWDEERFGREYDLDDYMIVSIDDFNMGAMENKGLNIFNSRLVLADENAATDQDFHRIESVVGHEYFHNWTGNRVTLRDWFHLSLKEGLTVFRDQEFSADMTDADIQRINDVNDLRERQFTEDAGPNAHPVRPESCYSVDNFYTATIYEKGSEVIRMMSTMVGRRGFRDGMDAYFNEHDGHAVTIEDFVKSIAGPNKKDWSQFRLWYSQAGTPTVEVQENYDEKKKEFHLHLKQTCPPTPGQDHKKPFHIPMSFELFTPAGHVFDIHSDQISRNSEGNKLIELKSESMDVTFRDIGARPVLSLLRQFSAPINLKWDRSDTDLFFLMTKDTDGFNRREAALSLSLKFMKRVLADIRKGQTPQPDGAFVEAFKAILTDTTLSPAFKALMMEMPSENYLIQKEDIFDPAHFLKARQWAHTYLAQIFSMDLQKLYAQEHPEDAKSVEFSAAGRRKLRNSALMSWVQSGETKALDAAVQQYKKSKNMTDRIAALASLSLTESTSFDELLEDFRKTWRHEGVVMNKWFALQAFSSRKDTYQRVKSLMNHPDFSIKNPNNVYSLLLAFSNNISVCHSTGGDVYEFLVDHILKIDELNPQVGARLCGLFDYTAKMPAPQKAQLKAQAERALNHSKLSKNTRELIEPVVKL
jgi:aminopeptidase N